MDQNKSDKYTLMKQFWRPPNLVNTVSTGVNEYTLQFVENNPQTKTVLPTKGCNKSHNPKEKKEKEGGLYYDQVVNDCVVNVAKKKIGYCFTSMQLDEIYSLLLKIGYLKDEIKIDKYTDSSIFIIQVPYERRCSLSQYMESR